MTRRLLTAALLAITLLGFAVPAGADDRDFQFLSFIHSDITSEFSNDWGAGRSGGRGHKGNDVFSPKGTPVLAAADGFVEKLGNGPRSGFYVKLRHADGFDTWYMHLDNDTPGTDDAKGGSERAYAEGIEEGDFVEAGQIIGYVGDSGNAEYTTPHTHFELHRDGRAINPHDYLEGAMTRWLRVESLADELA
ncbi:MAG: M23 family metallopeptidase [Acidimicrobiia bacterium]|nr:M23 family metallopeptidase [Acidimicrobiia bacterium]